MVITHEQLITTEAQRFTGCDRYEIDTSGSLHMCINCGNAEAGHVVRALLKRIAELEAKG